MKQLSIFTANQLQHLDSIVGVFHKPYSGILFSMLAPFPLPFLPSGSNDLSQYPVKVRCLAIDNSGLTIVAPLIMFDGDCEKLLSQLSECIEETKQNYLDSHGAIQPLFMAQIKDATFWNLHKKTSSSLVEQWLDVSVNSNDNEPNLNDDFYDNLQNQLIDDINYSINFLNPIIKEIMNLRPNLDLTIISSFMYKANVYGGNAMAYAEQALRIEPIPILRLIASEPSGQLLETVFSGARLPKALSTYLEVKPIIIRHLSAYSRLIPDMSVSLLNALITVLSNLECKYWPSTRKKWVNITEAIQACHLTPNNHVISDGGPWVETVAASLKISSKPSMWQGHILNRFKSYITLEKAAFVIFKKLNELTPKLVVPQTLGAVSYDEKKQHFAFFLVKSFLENNPRQFSQLWLSIFPQLKPIYVNAYRFDIVTSIEVCHYYGKIFDNCLQRDNEIMANLFPNKMIFCVSSYSKPLALATVSIHDGNNNIYASCHQLRGKGNSEVDDAIKKASLIFMDKLITNTKDINSFDLFSNAMLNLCSSSNLKNI